VIAALLTLTLDRRLPRKAGVGEGFRVVARTQGLVTLLGLTLVVGVFGWSYVVLLPVFAADVLRVGEEGYGLLMAASGIGSVVGSLGVAWVRKPSRKLTVLAVGVLAPAVFLFSLSRSFALSFLLLALTGMGMTAFFSTANTLVQTAVGDDVRGRVMGVYALVFGAIMPIGAAQAGGLAHAIGAPATVRIGAVVCALAALLFLGTGSRSKSN